MKELEIFSQLKADISIFLSPVSQVNVVDADTARLALDALKTIKLLIKQVESKQKEILDPLTLKVKEVREYGGEIKEPLLGAELFLKRQLVSFEQKKEVERQALRAEEEKRRKEEEQIAQEKEASRLAALNDSSEAASLFGVEESSEEIQKLNALAQAEAETQVKIREAEAKQRAYDIEKTKLSASKKIWKCELVDIDLVPAHFVIRSLNSQAILSSARGGVTEIPGVKIWQDIQIAVTANTSLKQFSER